MPAARVGSAVVTGHACDAATTIAGPGATTVLIEGVPAARLGDLTTPHLAGIPPFCSIHTMPIIGPGCPTVIVQGQPISKVGENVDAVTITSGATTVLVCGS